MIFKPKQIKLPVDAVIFDLDGTIIDSIGIYYKIVAAVLERLGLPQVSTTDLRNATENGGFDWSLIFPEQIKDNKEELIKNAWKIAEEISPKMFLENVKLIPGAANVLTRVSERGIKLAVVTSTPQKNMTAKLKPLIESGIRHLIKEIITADDTNRKKPAADPVVECNKRLGIAAGKSVYVGDMRLDIKAGKAAGTKTIGVLTGFDDFESLKKEKPDAIIKSIAELPDVIFM
ncbi:MAG: HAD family hydrolase [Deltaproteobacteria bacterium]|nr:HAD family hydrolase [Deltaproteobacteria bacterium]